MQKAFWFRMTLLCGLIEDQDVAAGMEQKMFASNVEINFCKKPEKAFVHGN
jgi:hypothetical protein